MLSCTDFDKLWSVFDPLAISLSKILQVNSMSLDAKNVRTNPEKIKIVGQSLCYLVHFIPLLRHEFDRIQASKIGRQRTSIDRPNPYLRCTWTSQLDRT